MTTTLWIAAIALSAGAALGTTISSSVVPGCMAAIGAVLIARPPRRAIAGVGVALISCAGGIVVGHSDDRAGALVDVARSVPRCEFRGRVIERAGGLGTLVDVTVPTCGAARGVAVLDGAVGEPGGSIEGAAWVVPLSDDGFGRARWHAGARVHLVGDVRVVRPPRATPLRAAARLRALLRGATHPLPADRAGLLLGLTIGETDQLAPGVVADFRRSGLAHLVAVSGSNVALVVGSVGLLARRRPLRVRVMIAAATLVLYVLVVGPDPSV
ncbi:MAG: ComEC/Rec2 family competence protein, partial [Actinomycetota bacterium]|nr:ComEC/Rec2 family competence protein [Actinomycetota bacterium]